MDVKTVCLGVLTLGEATGYEIRKAFEEGPFQYFTDAGFGSIYPALNRLHREGLVTCQQKAQDGRPDKKIYSITDRGRSVFAEAIQDRPGPDKVRSDLLLALFFEHLLPRTLVADAIDERIAWYRGRIAHMESCDAGRLGAGPAFVNGFGRAIYAAALDYLERHRDELAVRETERAVPRAAE